MPMPSMSLRNRRWPRSAPPCARGAAGWPPPRCRAGWARSRPPPRAPRACRRAPELGVARQQLHLVVHAPELHHLLAAVAAVRAIIVPPNKPGLADAARDLGRNRNGLPKSLGREFDPDLVVLLPERQRAVDLLGVLDDRGKRRRLPGRQAAWRRPGRKRGRAAGRRRRGGAPDAAAAGAAAAGPPAGAVAQPPPNSTHAAGTTNRSGARRSWHGLGHHSGRDG